MKKLSVALISCILLSACGHTAAVYRPAKIQTKHCSECDRPVVLNKFVVIKNNMKAKAFLPKLMPVYFYTGKAKLIPQSIPILEQNVKIIRKYDCIKKVRIVGHADDRGGDKYNVTLALQRAQYIKRLMSPALGSERFEVVSKGKRKPYVSTKSPWHFSQNRRVEFEILQPSGGVHLEVIHEIQVIKRPKSPLFD